MPRKKIPVLLKAGNAELIAQQFRSHKDTISILTKFIRDRDIDLRYEAIKALGLTRRREAAVPLETLIPRSEGTEIRIIAEALTNLGDAGIERAILGLRDPKNRTNYLVICKQIGNEELWKTTFSANIISPELAMKLELLVRIYHDLNYSSATVYDPALKYLGDLDNLRNILTEGLRDSSPQIRKNALSASKRYKTFRSLISKELVELLNDVEEDIQTETIKILGEMGSEAAQDGLIRKLTDSIDSVRLMIVETLGSMKSVKATLPLIKLMKEERNPKVLLAVKEALGNIGAPAAVPLIKELVHEEYMHHIEDTLKRVGEPAVAPLADALVHPNLKIRKHALSLTQLILTSKYGIGGTIERLIDLLTDRSPEIRKTLVETIINFGDPAIEHSIEALKVGALRENAKILVNHFGPFNIKIVLERFKNQDLNRAIALGTILVIYSDNEDLKDLGFETVGESFEMELSPEWIQRKVYDSIISPALIDKNSNIRFSAAQLSQFFGKIPLSEEHLLKLLVDKDPEVVEATLDTLGIIADVSTISEITPRLSHKSPKVVEAAREALSEIEAKNSFLGLITALKEMSDRIIYNFINEMCAQEHSKAENYIAALESEHKFARVCKRLRRDLELV
ncbi:MAG: HEAT repeat domain-containing protein [Candidatus Hodarchaeota archaeon]